VLARIAQALPGASAGRLRWIRALKGEVVQQIAVDDVMYFQASDKYTSVITREGESLIRLPLADLARELDADAFAQIHRSTVVNLAEVASSRRDLGGRVFVKLKDGTELAVSRAYAHLFKQM
jgi:DNA-binding LytR/AlgR family response regulator